MTQRSCKRAVALLAAGVTAFFCLACGAVLTPPMRAQVGTGPAVGHITTTLRGEDGRATVGQVTTPAVAATSEVRIGLFPQQLIPERLHRRWDVGVGWSYQNFYASRRGALASVGGYHAVFLEGGWYPWISNVHAGSFGRFGVHLNVDLPFADDALVSRSGFGVTAATTLEWVGGFAAAGGSGADDHANAGGWGVWGEGSLGLRLAMSAYDVGDQIAWCATMGITVEFPGFAAGGISPETGVAVVAGLAEGLAGVR